MIEIPVGSIEEQILRILQEVYPITVEELEEELKISRKAIKVALHKLQMKGILQLEPLPDKTYIRLLRRDFKFIQKKRQYRFIKHRRYQRNVTQRDDNEDNIMYV